jgi:hypothetical protein
MPEIVYLGKKYHRLEDMPPEARQAYEQAMSLLADRDGNGMPDIFDAVHPQGSAEAPMEIETTQTTVGSVLTSIEINGQTYTSVQDMPPEVRQAYEQAMAQLSAHQEVLTAFAQLGEPQSDGTAPTTPRPSPASQRSSAPLPASLEPEGLDLRGALLILAIVLFLLIAIGAVLLLTGMLG